MQRTQFCKNIMQQGSSCHVREVVEWAENQFEGHELPFQNLHQHGISRFGVLWLIWDKNLFFLLLVLRVISGDKIHTSINAIVLLCKRLKDDF